MKKKPTYTQVKKALVRAFENHGHEYFCSAARGMESDCHCGWLEVRELVGELIPTKRKSKS